LLKRPKPAQADAYMAKGDLDAALKDFNTVLGLNSNSVRAHAGRGQLFEKRRDLTQARADYRSAAFALTPFDEIDVARARAMAQERLAALTAQGPAGITTRRIALIVGNGAYKNVHPLDNPPRDAKLIAASLHDLGFQTVTLANDLTRDKFFEALHTFATEAEKADRAVVYYAGHGLEIGGVNYLVPIDARLAADKDAETEAVALEQVIAAVGGTRKLRLVLLDACRDNPFEPTAADHRAEIGRQGAFQYRARCRFHGGVRRQARRDRARWRRRRQSVRGCGRARHQGTAYRSPQTVRHRPRRRLDLDQTRAAALHLRLAARPR
jgi:Caspase domain/Tetratricopeptide repeat